MEVNYTPTFTGKVSIEVSITVNGKTGAAAGSALRVPDFEDAMQVITDIPEVFGALLDFAEGFTQLSRAGIETNAYIKVSGNNLKQEVSQQVGGKGLVGYFPIPPFWQNGEFNSEVINLSTVIPVVQGESVLISTGINTSASVDGAAEAHWNPLGDEKTYVNSITVNRVN